MRLLLLLPRCCCFRCNFRCCSRRPVVPPEVVLLLPLGPQSEQLLPLGPQSEKDRRASTGIWETLGTQLCRGAASCRTLGRARPSKSPSVPTDWSFLPCRILLLRLLPLPFVLGPLPLRLLLLPMLLPWSLPAAAIRAGPFANAHPSSGWRAVFEVPLLPTWP